MDKPDERMPREILESEYKHSLPPRPERPGLLGLPPIPDDLFDIIVKYLPWLVLAAAALNGFGAAGMLIVVTSGTYGITGPGPVFSALFSLLASVAGVGAYFWLSDKRLFGWYLLVLALLLQFFSGLFVSGARGVLSGGISLLLTVYIMLQIRDEYS